jgi:hypothetical protein
LGRRSSAKFPRARWGRTFVSNEALKNGVTMFE